MSAPGGLTSAAAGTAAGGQLLQDDPATRLPAHISAAQIRRVLRQRFGLRQWRQGQAPVIARVMNGRSTLARMPTGAGKSLCYQLPAVMLPGRTVVVSPLIALMKDQCDHLQSLGIEAVAWHGSLSADEAAQALEAVRGGRARVVFTTPEQLSREAVLADLGSQPVSLLVVDEAHCIAQWGFDFRPAFAALGEAIQALGKPTVLALTATATREVSDEICRCLGIPRSGVLCTGLYRENLRYAVEHLSRPQDKMQRIVELVQQEAGCGLVYAATIKAAEAVQSALHAAGEPAGLYHGRLPAAQRHAAQDAFMTGQVRVMVATNAFGLGIDKPDIRFVIHHQMPGSLEAYCQESGRAGRDGQPSLCCLLHAPGDTRVQQFFLAGSGASVHDLEAVLSAVDRADDDSLPVLAALSGLSERRVSRVLSMLQRQLEAQRAGEAGKGPRAGRGRRGRRGAGPDGNPVAGMDTGPVATLPTLQSLMQQVRERRAVEAAQLARMTDYLNNSECRWNQLLSHLDDKPSRLRCQQCDNCQRWAALLAEQAEQAATDAPPVETSAAPDADAPRWQPGQVVSTRRHGAAEVLRVDADGVTVVCQDGAHRCFLPECLSPAQTASDSPSVVTVRATDPLSSEESTVARTRAKPRAARSRATPATPPSAGCRAEQPMAVA